MPKHSARTEPRASDRFAKIAFALMHWTADGLIDWEIGNQLLTHPQKYALLEPLAAHRNGLMVIAEGAYARN